MRRRRAPRRSTTKGKSTPFYKTCGVAKAVWLALPEETRLSIAKRRKQALIDAYNETKTKGVMSGSLLSPGAQQAYDAIVKLDDEALKALCTV